MSAASGASGAPGVDGAIDQLYGAPLDGFVALRKKLVTELRAAGDRPGAQTVAAVTKPSRTAWALNQVARKEPALVQAVLDARTKAASAPKGGDAEAMRATARAYRDRVNDVVQAATAALREGGADLTAAQGRTIGETLQAIAGGEDEAARATLLAGRLAEDIAVDDPFAGIDVGALKPRAEGKGTANAGHAKQATHATAAVHAAPVANRPALHVVPSEKDAKAEMHRAREAKAREEQARAREEAARAAREREAQATREKVAALEAQAREGRAAARVAEVAAMKAQAQAEHLRRKATALDKELADAKTALRSQGS